MRSIDAVDDEPIFDIGPVEGEPAPDVGVRSRRSRDASSSLQQVRVRDQSSTDRKTGLLLAVGAIAIAVTALIAIPLFTGADDPAEMAGADVTEPGDDDPSTDNDSSREDPPGSAEGGFEPPSAPHLRADEVAWLFGSGIDTDLATYGLAYVADGDFVVLDHRGINVPELEIAADFATVANLALLTTDGKTWAINPDQRDESYLVSNSYVVVVSERPGTIAVIRPEDRTEIGLMSSALPVPSVPLPEGADLLWVQGRGPLVMPRTGGTFEVSGLASSLERISDDRAIAASAQSTIYESCDDLLACRYFNESTNGIATELPFESNTGFVISPDGATLVAATTTSTVVYDVSLGAELHAFESDPTAVAWSPDSSFVAVVKDRELAIFYPETGELVSMQLNHEPDLESLLVFVS